MANPQVSASLDKATYAPGETMTLTVAYSDADTRPISLEIKGVDTDGHVKFATVASAVYDPVTVTVTDSEPRAWTKVSDNGSVAVFQATA